MSKATIQIEGLDKALKRMDEYTAEQALAVSRVIEFFTYQIADDAREFAPKDTTALARSITPEVETKFGFSKEDQTFEGRVFTNIPYAKVVEFGFSGVQNVTQHSRTITQVFGQPIQPTQVTVKAHPRRVNRRGSYYMTRAAEKNSQPLVDMIKSVLT